MDMEIVFNKVHNSFDLIDQEQKVLCWGDINNWQILMNWCEGGIKPDWATDWERVGSGTLNRHRNLFIPTEVIRKFIICQKLEGK